MRKIVLLFIVCMSLSINAQNELQQALDRFNYLEVDKILNKYDFLKDSIPPIPYYFIKAYTDNALARYMESDNSLSMLSEMQEVKENPSLMIQMLSLQADNYAKTFQYKQVAGSYKKTIDNYGDLLGEAVMFYQNNFRINNALSVVEPLRVQIPHETKIQLIPDKEHIHVQVRTPKDSVLLIFDTGAGMSMVTKSVAERLGIKVLADSLIGGGILANTEYMSIGIADTLYLGDILYENVAFLILEDEHLTWSEHDMYINGMLGFPEIKVLSSMKIHKNGVLEIYKNEKKQQSNMMFSSTQQMIVQVNDSLLFMLDTGANKTHLSVNYYNEKKERIHKAGQLTTTTIGGIGGMKEFSVYKLKDFPITINTSSTILSEIAVFTQPISVVWYEYHGQLGLDIINQYDYMLLDFKNMYFSLGNTE